MTEAARYAIYLAPPPDSAFWRFGSDVIGRDAATGAQSTSFALEGLDAERWRGMTVEPRRYGFHATIKAPFRLRENERFADLCDAAATLAAAQAPFELGPLRVSTIAPSADRAFVAVTPSARSTELERLESEVVRSLDRFRAPLTPAERARRNPERLTPRQREHLDKWGYPYALEEFRAHFTLTDAIADFAPVARALAREFAQRVAPPSLTVDALVLFAQPQAGGDFSILRRFPFQATAAL
jgi:2'-5' RNA ligase